MAVLPLLLSLGGALIEAGAAGRAANAQSAAARDQLDLYRDINASTRRDLAPFRAAGRNFLSVLAQQVGRDYRQSPGYDVRLRGGVDAIEAAAAARGGLFSGATGEALTRFGQDYAAADYDNWLSRVAGLAQMGQNAAVQQGGFGNAFAANSGNALAALGNARSAGAVGVGNALSGGLNNWLGIWQMNRLLGGGG